MRLPPPLQLALQPRPPAPRPHEQALRETHREASLWRTAAVPMENLCCSCMLTSGAVQALRERDRRAELELEGPVGTGAAAAAAGEEGEGEPAGGGGLLGP